MSQAETQYSLTVLKPDAIKRGVEDEIYQKLEQNGIQVEGVTDFKIQQTTAGRIYPHVSHKYDPTGTDFTSVMRGLEEYWETGGEVKVAVVSGENIGEKLRNTVGTHPHPEECEDGTIRSLTLENGIGGLGVGEDDFFNENLYRVKDDRKKQELAVRNLVHYPEIEEELADNINMEELKDKFKDKCSVEGYEPSTWDLLRFAQENPDEEVPDIDGQIATEDDRKYNNELERDANIFLSDRIDEDKDVQEELKRLAEDLERPNGLKN